MGIAERKLREKQQRSSAILKAAKRLISKHGVEGMSMNELADSTELNKATLYLYFSDKDDLIDTIVHEGLLLLEKKYEETDRMALSGLEKVAHLVRPPSLSTEASRLFLHHEPSGAKKGQRADGNPVRGERE